MLQAIPTHTWTQSTVDPHVYAFHDTGLNQVVDWCDDGSIRVMHPKRWRFARANLRRLEWESVTMITPGVDVLRRLLEREKGGSH